MQSNQYKILRRMVSSETTQKFAWLFLLQRIFLMKEDFDTLNFIPNQDFPVISSRLIFYLGQVPRQCLPLPVYNTGIKSLEYRRPSFDGLFYLSNLQITVAPNDLWLITLTSTAKTSYIHLSLPNCKISSLSQKF